MAVHERPWAVGVYLGFGALVGLAFAAPLAAALGGVTGAYPRGDLELLDPGGVMLVEGARRLGAQMAAVGAAWIVLAALALPLGVLVLAFVTALYAAPQRLGPMRALVRAARSLPAFVVVGVVALIAYAVVGGLIMMGGGAVVRSSWPEPPAREIARFGLLALLVPAAAAVGVLHDLTRAAVVVGPLRAYAAMRLGLRTARRFAGRAAWAYAWRTVLGLAALAAATWAGARLGQRSAGALLATAFVHQLGLAAVAWLRLSWLSKAARLVRTTSRLHGESRLR